MSSKHKYFVVSQVVKANNKSEAARLVAPRRRPTEGQVAIPETLSVDRISAVEARELAGSQ